MKTQCREDGAPRKQLGQTFSSKPHFILYNILKVGLPLLKSVLLCQARS